MEAKSLGCGVCHGRAVRLGVRSVDPALGRTERLQRLSAAGGARHSPLRVCLRELLDAHDQAIEHGARLQ